MSGTVQLLLRRKWNSFHTTSNNFCDFFLTVHLLLQSIVLPQGCSNLFAITITSKEKDIQEQVPASLQSDYLSKV